MRGVGAAEAAGRAGALLSAIGPAVTTGALEAAGGVMVAAGDVVLCGGVVGA
jgi:hypothetical protein